MNSKLIFRVVIAAVFFPLPIHSENGNLNQPREGVEWQFALASDPAAVVENLPMFRPWTWASVAVKITASTISAKLGDDDTLPKDPLRTNGMELKKIALQPFGTVAFRTSMFAVGK